MKTLVFLSLSIAVAVGVPVVPPGLTENPVLPEEAQSPLLGDQVPLQGQVEVEAPAPPPGPAASEQQLREQSLAENVVEGEAKLQTAPGDEAGPGLMERQIPVGAGDGHEAGVQSVVEVDPLSDTHPVIEEPTDAELAEIEKSVREAFLGPNAVDELLQGEEEEPVADLQPEGSSDYPPDFYPVYEYEEWPGPDPIPDDYTSIIGTTEPLPDFPTEEEARYLEGWLAGRTFIHPPETDELPVFGAQGGVGPARRRRAIREDSPQTQGKQKSRHCPGLFYGGKCYQFFKEPKRAADAEFFCQEQFPGGHLASVPSLFIHRELMALIHMGNGAPTRTWIGGLRFLDTGRFIWLDGSRWDYDDWLPGEPSHTADVEHCVEMLPFDTGKGKFNDFTCWEPQPFICSYDF